MRLALNNLSYHSENTTWIHPVSLTLDAGQVVVIKGRTGSGKSLLFSLLCGLVDQGKDKVYWDRLNWREMDRAQSLSIRRRMGVVFQSPCLLANLSLYDNLKLVLDFHRVQTEEQTDFIRHFCRQFELQDYLALRPEELSAGQLSLAALARALILQPEVLLWDTPLATLDLEWGALILDILDSLRTDGVSLVLCSNRSVLVERLNARVWQLEAGYLSEVYGH